MGLNTVASYVVYASGNPVLLCVVGSHLLLRLKQAADNGRDESTSYKPDISAMNFDLGPMSENGASGM